MGEHPPPPPKDYVTPQERLAEQDWASVAGKGITSMAPADKGWILAVVVIFSVMTLTNFMSHRETAQLEKARGIAIHGHLNTVEEHRQKQQEIRADEMRRMQEVVKELTQAIVMQTSREGRVHATEDTLRGAAEVLKEDAK